jgi:hypothetical protein
MRGFEGRVMMMEAVCMPGGNGYVYKRHASGVSIGTAGLVVVCIRVVPA